MKKVSVVLTLVLLAFVGYFIYKEYLNKEEIDPNEEKLREYSNQILEVINNSDYSFESTLIDNEWLTNNLESNISCDEVYYSNDNKILLHHCLISNKDEVYYMYDKFYKEENDEYKKIYEEVKNEKINIEKGNLLSDIATIDLELGITEIDSCSESGICPTGTEFAIQVNDNTVYRFYVLTDDGEKVELIMDKNLLNHVTWAPSDNGDGPTDTLEQLQKATESWSNIPLRNYRVVDDNNGKVYDDIHMKIRAIIPSYTKLVAIDPVIPNWLSGDSGYWLSSASKSMSFYAWVINTDGSIDTADVSSDDYGVRPMIVVYK